MLSQQDRVKKVKELIAKKKEHEAKKIQSKPALQKYMKKTGRSVPVQATSTVPHVKKSYIRNTSLAAINNVIRYKK